MFLLLLLFKKIVNRLNCMYIFLVDYYFVVVGCLMKQQKFCENLQKENISKNAIITGIPNENLELNDGTYEMTTVKVSAIIQLLDNDINEADYNLVAFHSAQGRQTRNCKLTYNNLQKKDAVIKKAIKLKDVNELKGIYIIKWDAQREFPVKTQETRITSTAPRRGD